MANEKSAGGSFKISVGKQVCTTSGNFTGDLTGQPCSMRQSISTATWQALDIPAALASIERILIVNEDAANYVEIAFDNAGSSKLAKLVAKDWLYVPLPASTTALYAKANTASVWISFTATEP